jgi:hypothetical protein
MILELVSCVGLHWILKYGTILNLPRVIVCKVSVIEKLFKCSLCLGFWVGAMVSIYTDGDIFLYGLASAGVCWFFDNINNAVQSYEIKLDNES